ncbi:RNA-binding S4 domain-containing protein [Anaerotalea alkaliphila]|uniref:RNA-binding S4 domain-containing protein n=1 Tax=Anaerotalea alkaliphila TaxID=2662126 RepID=A0A7X5HWW2_9FIRM|nr:RNA-binding S4 domain-containing protein [Anaerotalea alkaliphila]NDL68093.1 RNA-binding S4 domain-containing protein [Anaerotalea alkaliphila]
METIKIDTPFIKLGQFLKLAGLADSGVHAKILILEGVVQVNGVTETQRGKKLHPGDVVVVGEEAPVQVG